MKQTENATILTQPLKESNKLQEEPDYPKQDLNKFADSDVVTMQPMLGQDPSPHIENASKQAEDKPRNGFWHVCFSLVECAADCSDILCCWLCCKLNQANHNYHVANENSCCDDCCKCDNCCDCGDCNCGDCDCGDCDCGGCDCGDCIGDCNSF